MKRSSIFMGFGLLLSCSVLFAQTADPAAAPADSVSTYRDYKTEVYTKENIPYKHPIPYVYVREADVLFEKTIWRMVNLDEKQNLSLYFPTEKIGSRVNLVNLLLMGVESGEITAYATDDALNEFVRPMDRTELDMQFGAKKDTIMVSDADGNMIAQMRDIPRRTTEVRKLLIKEKIYFDKKHSTLNRVVIGICPIRVYSKDDGSASMEEDGGGSADMLMMKTMWIYMPEARPILARHPIFNRFNDAQNISFDDFFMQNMYSGYIYQISDVYNNRRLEEYAAGVEALYESQRIIDEIFNFEQDLWEY